MIGCVAKARAAPPDAIIETCRERARPVVLTAVTAILGVLPIAFGVNLDFILREVTVSARRQHNVWINLSTAIVFRSWLRHGADAGGNTGHADDDHQ